MTLATALLLALPCMAAVAATSRRDEAPWVIGLEQLHRIDLMPAFKRSVSIGGVSSYDRTGGNDDGFSGTYSYVRKEGEGLVLADLKGPGCIYRIHTPTPPDDLLEFYFDGESKPRISVPFRELYSGKTAPFVKPLVDEAVGGFTCYVPIPYEKSCKIVLRGKHMQFYDLNYATFPAGSPVRSFEPKLSDKDRKDVDAAVAMFTGGRTSPLTDYNVPKGSKIARHPFSVKLQPGKAATLFEAAKGGRIVSLRVGPEAAFEGKGRDVQLRITWDGDKQPAVCCPAGDFFGYAWGKPGAGCCLLGTEGDTNYCNLPMPYDHAAKIELVSSTTDGPALELTGEVITADSPRKSYEGKFYAVWHRENPTTEGKPFTFIDTKGRGHIVGLALQAQGTVPGSTPFFEGDDQTTIDGELVVHGTGSEDFFNGGWYDVPGRWDRRFACSLSGCMLYDKAVARTGGYRFFIGDAYSYRQSILQTIEHAPERNEGPADYCAVTYLYSESRPTEAIAAPAAEERRVADPPKVVFAAHWTLPILAFSFDEATITRKDVPAGSGKVRCLSLRGKAEDWFGAPFVSFECRLPAAGRYRVSMSAVRGPEQAIVRLMDRRTPIGPAVDLYAPSPWLDEQVELGEAELAEGPNALTFEISGKHAAASGFGLDLASLAFEAT